MVVRKPVRIAVMVLLPALAVAALTVPSLRAGADPAPDSVPASCSDLAVQDDDAVFFAVDLAMLSADPPRFEAAPPKPGKPDPKPDEDLPKPGGDLPSPGGDPPKPKPPGADLRPPDQSLLNGDAPRAAQAFRQSLTDSQRTALNDLLARHRPALEAASKRLPGPPAGNPSSLRTPPGKPQAAPKRDEVDAATADLRQVGEQIDAELTQILTPEQRDLFQKGRPSHAVPGPLSSGPPAC